jgi:hypothetical protein
MNQLTLFDRPQHRTEFADTCSTKGMKGEVPLARRSDPPTSHKAATETEPQLSGLQSCCMIILGRALSPRTANEIAAECVRQYGKMAESYRKRLHELVGLGKAIECGERACEVTGKSAMTFKAKECK